MAIDRFATSIAGGKFASRQFVRWFWAISFASAACLVGSPCQTQTAMSQSGSAKCGQAGCTSLTINGKHACASLPLDFDRFAATSKLSAPRVLAGPLGAATFELHSRPGATKTIFLDFDGHVTTNTGWNDPSVPTITTTAFDFDNDPTTFSAAEQARILEIWQRVSECYSPFDIDVTTEDPTVANLVKSGAGDTKWGMRVLFGVSSPDPTNGQGGGVAFLFSFGDNPGNGVDTPCFVLAQGVGTAAKSNADACVHEVGHTLGLRHDGLFPSNDPNHVEYYSGQGSGIVAWAPHMGVGYYVPLVQWSKGEYANPSNTEDDLNIITNGQWGFGYRPDDYSNTTSAAKPIPGTAGTSSFAVNASGVIETRADVDVFKITTGSGTIKLDAVGGPACTMLDIQLSLYDSKGALVVAANPPTDVIASISQTVPAGVYYARIEGVSLGNPLTTGYTDYSSLGQYTITGSFSTKGLKGAPVLSVASNTFYGIKGLPVAINPNIKVADPDNTTQQGATVTITNVVAAQDVLSLQVNPATMGNITSSYNAQTGVLTLNSAGNTATLLQFQNALRAVSYSNKAASPNKTPRKIDFQVNDGTITSNILTSTVTIGNYYIVVDYNPVTKLMTINDDVGDNSFAITLRAGRITVEGAGATLVGNATTNSQSVSFPFSGNLKINVKCTTGNDTVSFVGVQASEVNAVMGDGDDRVNLTYCNMTQFYMNGQNGTDVLTLVGNNLTKKFTYSVP